MFELHRALDALGRLVGRLWFGNNELATEGYGPDAVKNRIAAQPGYAACVSFNAMRADNQHDEHAMIRSVANPDLSLMEFAELVRVDDTEQGMVYARRIAPDPDNGNRMTIFYHLPVKYYKGKTDAPAPTEPAPTEPPPPEPTPTEPTPTEPPPPDSTAPATDYPSAILYRLNCTGEIDDLRTIGDDVMVRAVSPSLDVRVEVEIPVSAPGTLNVEFIRNEGGEPAPYCYVYVNDSGVWQMQLIEGRVVARVSVSAGVKRVKALVSAQNGGSCHIGGIVVTR